MTRRKLLQAAALTSVSAAVRPTAAEPARAGLSLGVASASYSLRFTQDGSLRDPLHFLKFCRERGASGVQTAIPMGADPKAIRSYLAESGTWLEGSVRLPQNAGDVDRFERDVDRAWECGAEVIRTVLTGARRYEAFSGIAEVKAFRQLARIAVQLAEPVVTRRKIRLAIENHKDLRAEEQVELLKAISSEYVGATLDTGNSLALLEEPLETLAALAPWTFSVHLKDMAVDESREGFLLAEIPLGQGFLPLQQLVDGVRKQRPGVRFHLEMITRDPLVVPCLTDRYWAMLEGVPPLALARTISLVRTHAFGKPIPGTAEVAKDARVTLEDENVRRCLDYARTQLKTS